MLLRLLSNVLTLMSILSVMYYSKFSPAMIAFWQQCNFRTSKQQIITLIFLVSFTASQILLARMPFTFRKRFESGAYPKSWS